jgi:hypothetical protein
MMCLAITLFGTILSQKDFLYAHHDLQYLKKIFSPHIRLVGSFQGYHSTSVLRIRNYDFNISNMNLLIYFYL